MNRVTRAWQALGPEQRLAAVSAFALFVTMFLPWYQQNGVTRGVLISRDLNAFAVFSFIEGAILLAALLVLVTLFLRAEGRHLRLPGSDGAVVLAAGAWTALLLIIRLFDKPGVSGDGAAADVGVQWGIFFALAAAGLLSYAGARLRAIGQPRTRLLRNVSETITKDDYSVSADDDYSVSTKDDYSEIVPEREIPKVVSARDVRSSRANARPARSRRDRGSGSEGTGADSEQLSFEDTASVAGKPPSDPSG
ncbi:MAG TPA: hypothetical protein VGF95_14030 [Solirubrobacteraceae bacterium]|jgi:hypothetical protein